MKKQKNEMTYRQWLIDSIEGNTGTLASIPYHLIETKDLAKLQSVLKEGVEAYLRERISTL